MEIPASEETVEEVETTEVEETEEVEEQEESIEDYKARLAKAEEVAENQKKRAEKAEAKAKTSKVSTPSLSAKDFLAIKDANLAAEDYDEVQEYANFKKITIAEALGTQTMKTILAERAEERRTAQASATRSPRGTSKPSGEQLLQRARSTGTLPDDDSQMADLFNARLRARLGKKD